MRDMRTPSLTHDSRFSVQICTAHPGKLRFRWWIVERGKDEPVQVSMAIYLTTEKAFEAAQPALLEWRRGEAT
jgi:hypothetical protein